jgi:hypothetical protein
MVVLLALGDGPFPRRIDEADMGNPYCDDKLDNTE